MAVYRFCLIFVIAVFVAACADHKSVNTSHQSSKPNIIVFYVDDLGYGDLSSYGAKGVETPNIDQLAANGIRFTDAHTSAATCTPSRYSLLTGEYAFRNQAQVLQGDAPLLIPEDKATLASLLKKADYKTAVVGKWHLGLGNGNVDWNKKIAPGPLELGFDYSFLLPATGDRVPTVYVENHHVMNLDNDDPLFVDYQKRIGERADGLEQPELLRQAADTQHSNTIVNGISRIGWMAGAKSAEWVDEEFHEVFTEKAKRFISDNQQDPFFLFFSFHDIHVPRLPNPMFKGKSSMGPRGDAIVQMDWITGQVISHLENLDLLENSFIVFTSDNGAVLNDGYEDQALELLGQHKPNGPFNGGKYSAYEGGTRVPMIVSYPTKVSPGVSDSLMTQVDLYASVAALLNLPLASDEAIDSENTLAAWLDANKAGRETVLEQSITFSLRQGPWKYIQASEVKPNWIADKGIESGVQAKAQLYNLSKDIAETENLAEQYPDKVKAMQAEIDAIVAKQSR
ncbi:arylsulfatase [Agaribacterium sp. ZY112]|uniref:sulfatase family protein n=1 Tax=Agaribacterium sp. ZY112 TaxID=3233574 RepID=UPI00352577FA